MGLLRRMLLGLAATMCASCAWMPRELNLSPLWFHRLDEQGEVLEYDLLWPIVHYERTPAGGDDFRIRPLWRRVTEPEPEAVEHQFLWPLGRVRSDAEESSSRLFPFWNWRSRINEEGARDVDWYLLFPFIWGGASADGRENYLAVLPFYADIPQFLTYDRFTTVLFPLYLRLDKEGHRHHQALWPFIGWSSCAENGHSWFRILPFYGHDIEPGQHDRRFVLWPFFAWSEENEFGEDPVHSVWIWPLVGWRTGRTVSGWMLLWPLFQYTHKTDHFTSMSILWPFFRYYWNRVEDHVTQWWLWPFVSRVRSDDQRTWSFLWPLIWWRSYVDPDRQSNQQWILPFFWHIDRHRSDEAGDTDEDFVKVWPLLHRTTFKDADGNPVSGDFSLLSPLPWRDGNATGATELYGFLWELFTTRRRAADDAAVDVTARLFTSRERAGTKTASVPFLGSYERDARGRRTVRLLGIVPISWGGDDRADDRAAAPHEEAPR